MAHRWIFLSSSPYASKMSLPKCTFLRDYHSRPARTFGIPWCDNALGILPLILVGTAEESANQSCHSPIIYVSHNDEHHNNDGCVLLQVRDHITSFASFDRRYHVIEDLSHRPKAAATPTASFTLPLDLYNDVHVLAA